MITGGWIGTSRAGVTSRGYLSSALHLKVRVLAPKGQGTSSGLPVSIREFQGEVGASLGFLGKGQVDTFLQSVTFLPVMD